MRPISSCLLTFVIPSYILSLLTCFVDGGVDYQHYKGGVNNLEVGLTPGVAVNLNRHFSFVTKVGFLGWKNTKNSDSGLDTQAWGASFDNNHLTFGLYYNF